MELSMKHRLEDDKPAERFVVHNGGKAAQAEVATESSDDVVDNQLVARFIDGDMQAFDLLVGRYKERIYNFIYFQINQKQADAEDLTQDVFLEFYKQAANYRGESKFSTWLFSVSRNIVLNYFRSHRRRHSDKTDSISQTDFDDQPGAYQLELVAQDCPAESVINDNMMAKVDTAIGKLNPEERQLLMLTDREGFSYEQISNILSIKVGTVRSRLNTARNRLMQFLKVHDNDM